MRKRPFKIGDKVRVIGIPVAKLAPGVRDELGTNKLLKYMLGRVYTVKGYDKYGFVELEPRPLKDTVWIEPELLTLRARKRTVRKASR